MIAAKFHKCTIIKNKENVSYYYKMLYGDLANSKKEKADGGSVHWFQGSDSAGEGSEAARTGTERLCL